MANQVAARLCGDDYQHLYAWQCALELKQPNSKVRLVTVEDAFAGSVDDVTVLHDVNTNLADRFYQVKYHVDHRSVYSTNILTNCKPGEKKSLLEKFWYSWNLLRNRNPEREINLYLVSNWTWDTTDLLKTCFSGHDGSIKNDFLLAKPRSELGKIRKIWQEVLEAGDDDFQRFISCLRFKLGFDCSEELEKRVSERMEHLRLRSDKSALLTAVGIVRDWIKVGKRDLTLEEFESMLKEYKLYRTENEERGITIYLTTIKEQKFDISPDYSIDWREHFVGEPGKKGHQLKNPSEWNTLLLPNLKHLEEQINNETDCRLVRARGLARLSAWFAFGFLFSEVARYTIEVDQVGQLWRTDADPSTDFCLDITSNETLPEGEMLDCEGSTVAVGLSVTGSLDNDVREYLANRTDKVAALLLLRPERELGRDCLRSASDAVALADIFKRYVRDFVKRWKAKRLLLFYFGPLSGACFVGHRLNAVCQEIQIMEDQQPGYAPSFLLS